MKKLGVKKRSLIILFLTIILFGCEKKEEILENRLEETDKNEHYIEKEDESLYNNIQNNDLCCANIISNMYAEEGKVEIGYDTNDKYDFIYSYYIPKITEDTEGAREINTLIHEKYDGILEQLDDCKNHVEYAYEPDYFNISYEIFENNNILSIVIISAFCFNDFVEYDAYNYDFISGKRITNNELLAMYHITEEDFIKLVKITDLKAYDTCFDNMFEAYRCDAQFFDEEYLKNIYLSYVKGRLDTIKDNNINLDCPLYLDNYGELSIARGIRNPNGGETYTRCLTLEQDITEWDDLMTMELLEEYQDLNFYKGLFDLYVDEGYQAKNQYLQPDGTICEGGYYLGFNDSFSFPFVYQEYKEGEETLAYCGNLYFAGMDENGYIFEYKLNFLNNDFSVSYEYSLEGSFYLYPEIIYNEKLGECEKSAVYMWIEGDDLFNTNGNSQKLSIVYG